MVEFYTGSEEFQLERTSAACDTCQYFYPASMSNGCIRPQGIAKLVCFCLAGAREEGVVNVAAEVRRNR